MPCVIRFFRLLFPPYFSHKNYHIWNPGISIDRYLSSLFSFPIRASSIQKKLNCFGDIIICLPMHVFQFSCSSLLIKHLLSFIQRLTTRKKNELHIISFFFHCRLNSVHLFGQISRIPSIQSSNLAGPTQLMNESKGPLQVQMLQMACF